jgi:hypothetical protein
MYFEVSAKQHITTIMLKLGGFGGAEGRYVLYSFSPNAVF